MHTADEFLNLVWRWMRNDRSPMSAERALGGLRALHACGLVTDLEMEGWVSRFQVCPGHEDEGGRKWCAYCGTL